MIIIKFKLRKSGLFMPNTYSQVYIQIVFAVSRRQNLIPKQHREELHKYITGIVQKRENKMLSVFCMPDHVHLLTGFQLAGWIWRLLVFPEPN
jgi:hypothetical protein